MFAASKTGAVVSSGDPYWTSVSLLTNFENNLTFQDGSTNNFAITRNGVVNPSLNTPFSGGVGGSEYFNGSTGYLTTANSNINNFGTSDWTIEFWILSTQSGRVDPIGWNYLFSSSGWAGLILNVSASGQMSWYEGANQRINATSTGWNTGGFKHIAITRSGNNVRMFLNGSQVGSTYVTSASYGDNATGFIVGNIFGGGGGILLGNMSNLRIVKGTAVYTANFTPPTAPLTAITNTSLLITGTGQGMFDNATFVDQGPNALTVTATGAPVYSGRSPFGNTYPGSIYCPTLNDFVTGITTDNLSASDWTFEAWVNISTFVASGGVAGNVIISKCVTPTIANFGELTFAATTNGAVIYIRPTTGAAQATYQATSAITANTWTHVAAVYTNSNTTLKLYKNGTLTDTFTSVTNGGGATTTRYGIGQFGNGYAPFAFSGYISNARVAKTAVYTANFTPSTTPLTAITNTSLLVRGDTGAFYDLSNNGNGMTSTGTTAVTTQVKKYGAESASYTATAYQTVADAVNLQLGTGDYTIEAWVYRNAAGVLHSLICKGAAATGWLLQVNSSNQLVFTVTSTAILTSTTTIAATTWTFVTVTRSGTSTRLFVGGNLEATATDSTNFNQTNALLVGSDRSNANGLNGYLDDIRITKGVARYTATFTPPTVTFPTGP